MCTIAGDGTNGFNGEGLPAVETRLFYPSALALDPSGQLVVVDYNNMLVRKLDEHGSLVTIAGNNIHSWASEGLATDSAMENPIDVAFAPDGSFFVMEQHAARVLRVDAEGWLSIYAGTGDEGFAGDGGPATEAVFSEGSGLALDEVGNLYISDTFNHCIREVDPDGEIDALAGNGMEGSASAEVEALAATFRQPQRTRMAQHTLLVADTGNHVIRQVDLDSGLVSIFAGTGVEGLSGDGGPAIEASLSKPTSATLAPDGSVYIADTWNHVIRRVDPDGTIETVAGIPGAQGYDPTPAPATESPLSFPADMLIGEDGALYIADMVNAAVRRVAP